MIENILFALVSPLADFTNVVSHVLGSLTFAIVVVDLICIGVYARCVKELRMILVGRD